MIRLFITMSLIGSLSLSISDCGNKENGTIYKGRFEINGICMNHTIKLLEGEMSPGLIDSNWTDEHSKISYTNVFRLGNPCTFPPAIKAGDSFYFRIDPAPKEVCATCMAYYPTPSKSLSIKVVEK